MKRILLIDDNPIDLMIHEKLAKRGWGEEIAVTKKTSAQDALSYLNQCEEPPHLTLLDIKMPGMDGFEFISALRERTYVEKLPIYMLSSSIDPTDLQKAREEPLVRGFLEKPLSMEQLERCTFR